MDEGSRNMNNNIEKYIGSENIAEYLGLKNGDELAAKVLHKPIQSDVNLIYHSSNYFKINSISSMYDPNDMFSGLKPIAFNGRHVGWRCILSYDKYDFKKYGNNKPNFFKELRKSINPLEIGHILALELLGFVKCDEEWNTGRLKEICNSPEYNLVPQFQRANENSKYDVGQARFENWLYSKLTGYEVKQVYYEVEEIYYDTNDIVPIGTRIFACKYGTDPSKLISSNSKKLVLPFHVFIPNFGFNKKEKKFDSNYLLLQPGKIREFYRTCWDKWQE